MEKVACQSKFVYLLIFLINFVIREREGEEERRNTKMGQQPTSDVLTYLSHSYRSSNKKTTNLKPNETRKGEIESISCVIISQKYKSLATVTRSRREAAKDE